MDVILGTNGAQPPVMPPVMGTTAAQPDGGAVVTFADKTEESERVPLPAAGGLDHYANLALSLPEERLAKLASEALKDIADEEIGRKDWLEMTAEALKLLGLGRIEEVAEDLPDGAQTTVTLMLAAVQRFCGNALREMGMVDGPVIAKAVEMPEPDEAPAQEEGAAQPGIPPQGEMPEPDADAAAERVTKWFTLYLKEFAKSWFTDMDRTLNNTSQMGCSFFKAYADPSRTAPLVLEAIDPQHLIVPFDARSLYSGVPITHKIPNMQKHELLRRMETAIYRTIQLNQSGTVTLDPVTEEQRKTAGTAVTVAESERTACVYERNCWLILEEDPHPSNLPRPYLLTIHEQAQEVLQLRRAWAADDVKESMEEDIVCFAFQPGQSGVYGIGLGQILWHITKALKEGTNAALGAGWLANTQGGFMDKSFSIDREEVKFRRGTFLPTDMSGNDLTKSIVAFPFKGPDAGLIGLLERLDSDGRELAGMLTNSIAEAANSNTAPGTMLAALDEASIIPSSSHVRLFLALETLCRVMLRVAKRLWGKGGQLSPTVKLLPGDLDLVELVPTMRPGSYSKTRRIAEAQMLVQTGQQFPQLHDMRVVLTRFYTACGVEDIEDIMPPEEETKPSDPVTEARNALAGKPLKAAPTQDHISHMRAHQATAMLYAGRADLGDSGQTAAAAMQAHCGEHLALLVAVRVAGMLGMPLQMLVDGIPEELETRIAPQVAMALEQISKELQAQAAPDPALALQQMKDAAARDREELKATTQTTIAAGKAVTEDKKMRTQAATAAADDAMALRIAMLNMASKEFDAIHQERMATQQQSADAQQTDKQIAAKPPAGGPPAQNKNAQAKADTPSPGAKAGAKPPPANA